jgi:hypothetical protein
MRPSIQTPVPPIEKENVCIPPTHVHTIYYSAIEKNEILSFAAKRMELEDIMLSEIRQTQTTSTTTCSLFHVDTKKNPSN